MLRTRAGQGQIRNGLTEQSGLDLVSLIPAGAPMRLTELGKSSCYAGEDTSATRASSLAEGNGSAQVDVGLQLARAWCEARRMRSNGLAALE
ncbi:MAG: hypothetical protein JSW71_16425 [Gemmatimonadota bacterium]|nr:MAG: hypothetical protein JSW71_16425 [Gemmatimonadota bacterium]